MKIYDLAPLTIRQLERAPEGYARSELARLAVTYARVFAGPPWNEVSKCNDGFSPEPVGSKCDNCYEKRGPAYPLEDQMETIANELTRPDAACFVLEDRSNNELVGFSWGFRYNDTDEFLADKYDGDGPMYERLRQDVRSALAGVAIGNAPFYYLSETGIIDDLRYRGRGLSKEFVRLRSAVAEARGLDIVQRTSSESPMYRTMKSAGFDEVLGRNVGKPDVVNPQRALFVKRKVVS